MAGLLQVGRAQSRDEHAEKIEKEGFGNSRLKEALEIIEIRADGQSQADESENEEDMDGPGVPKKAQQGNQAKRSTRKEGQGRGRGKNPQRVEAVGRNINTG